MKKIALLTLVILAQITTAGAQISLNDVIVSFTPGDRPVHNVRVTNNSPKQAYDVQVTVEKVLNPGTPEEQREITRDIIVAPRQMRLSANNSRLARILLRHPGGQKENIYRIKFVPLPGKFGENEDNDELSSANVKTELKVLTGMGMLILVAPEQPKPTLKWTRDNTGITFTNTGNTNIQLRRQEFCPGNNKECLQLPGKRLYPGNSWHLALKSDASSLPITYDAAIYKEIQRIRIPAFQGETRSGTWQQ